jgi:hypothetical protein
LGILTLLNILVFGRYAWFRVKKNTQKRKTKRRKNGTKMKHPQMVASKQTPLWLFWDI